MEHYEQPSLSHGFKLRLLSYTVFIVSLLYYAKYFHYTSDDKNVSFKPIPMYIELNDAFEKLEIFLDSNKNLLMNIHQNVLEIVNIQVENKKVDKVNLMKLHVDMRRYIDEMRLYLPNDVDFHDIWETNIKIIIKVVNKIVKDLMKLK